MRRSGAHSSEVEGKLEQFLRRQIFYFSDRRWHVFADREVHYLPVLYLIVPHNVNFLLKIHGLPEDL